MRAARFHAAHEPLSIDDVATPEPSEDEVRIRVRASGVCGTELHFTDGMYAPLNPPTTLGHEVAGEVDAVGAAVHDVAVGDRVVVNYLLFCSRCRWCRKGQQHRCVNPRGLFAFVSDGGFAEHVVVPATCIVPLPDSIAFTDAAPLCCAGATAVHALGVARVESGEVVVVVGAGGVGLAVVQVAADRGARVVAVSRSAAKLQAARSLGAEVTVTPDAAAEAVIAMGGGDVVIETVGSAESLPASLGLLGRGGRLVLVGYSEAPLEVQPLALVIDEKSVLTSVGSTPADLAHAVDLAGRSRLRIPVDDVVALDDIDDALARLRRGDVVGRLVVVP
ncbi:MAG: alcohol dehydrogenase catalytic domain-containing protein [Actinomycetota bacterium]|nr:alcohol dehydrogenase catalytic domain-containing protein [Actinomycetota bacterium]